MFRASLSRLTATLVAAIATAVACTPSENSVSQADFAPELSSLMCSLMFDCKCDTTSAGFTSEAQCASAYESYLTTQTDEASQAGLHFDGECGADIIDTYKLLGCKTDSQLESDPMLVAQVLQMLDCKLFYGDNGEGAPCNEVDMGDSCTQGRTCDGGTCVPNDDSGLKKGAACDPADDLCGDGLLCDEYAASPVCIAWPGVGDTCYGPGNLCDYNVAYCDQGTKTCVPLEGIGGACGDTGYECKSGLLCDFNSSTCVAAPGAGEDCPDYVCASGYTCDDATMTCVAEGPVVCDIGP